MKQREGGRVTCLPPDRPSARCPAGEGHGEGAGISGGGSGTGLVSEVLRPAVNALLGRTVVVDHLDHGVQLAKARRYRFPVVTLEEILRPGGSMTGGSVNRRGPSLGGPRGALQVQWAQARQAAAKAARCWSVPAGKPSGRRRPWRPAKVPGPTPPETLLRSQNDQEETLRTLGERNWHLYGAPGGHSLRCLPSCGTSCGPLRQTRPARTGCSGTHGPANPGAGKREIAQREAKVETLGGCPAGTVCPAEQSTGQKLALERARGE